MKEYKNILLKLLSESQKNLDNGPVEASIDKGFVIEDIETGIKYTIEKVGTDTRNKKKLFKISRGDFSEVIDFKKLKEKYRRA